MNKRQHLTGREPGVQRILNGYTGKDITWSAETSYVVQHTNSYGGRRHLHIYVHPDDAPRLLPPAEGVTDNEKIVLTYTARLKNTYGGETNIRFREASRETKITAGEWENAKTALISRKLLNKAGAITVAGRNAIA